MDKLVKFTGLVVPMDHSDVDTDQIIPKEFLKKVEREGYGRDLFAYWRYDHDGNPLPDFVLNQQRYKGAQVLLARDNFGCGSSREHAVWALSDYGFRVLIAPSFADIFKNNCFSVGVLPVELESALVDEWFKRTLANEGYRITTDLPAQTLTGSDGFACSFNIDPVHKRHLVEGLDKIGHSLKHESKIANHEDRRDRHWQAAAADKM